MGNDIPVFTIGLIFGAALLLGGLGAGIWIGRRTVWRRGRSAEDLPLTQLLEGLFLGTDGVAHVVSNCRDALGRVGDHCRQAHEREADAPPDPQCVLFAEMLQTNEQVRQRLEAAEATLQRQAREISSYMSEARTDSLTGLPNRRALDAELSRRLADCRGSGTALSLVLLDIDHFKHLNDRHGHPAGDAVLAEVGHVLRDAIQAPHFVARLGGEEFAFVLPGCHGGEAGRTAEQVRQQLARHRIQFEQDPLRVTISYGVAELREQEPVSSLLKRADQALYASKAAGRNCGHLQDGYRCLALTAREPADAGPARRPSSKSPLLESDDFRRMCQDVRARLRSLVEHEGDRRRS